MAERHYAPDSVEHDDLQRSTPLCAIELLALWGRFGRDLKGITRQGGYLQLSGSFTDIHNLLPLTI